MLPALLLRLGKCPCRHPRGLLVEARQRWSPGTRTPAGLPPLNPGSFHLKTSRHSLTSVSRSGTSGDVEKPLEATQRGDGVLGAARTAALPSSSGPTVALTPEGACFQVDMNSIASAPARPQPAEEQTGSSPEALEHEVTPRLVSAVSNLSFLPLCPRSERGQAE